MIWSCWIVNNLICTCHNELTHDQWMYILEEINPLTTGNACNRLHVLVSIVAADGLVLQHQVISSHNTYSKPILLYNFLLVTLDLNILMIKMWQHIDGLVWDCSISIVNTLEILQFAQSHQYVTISKQTIPVHTSIHNLSSHKTTFHYVSPPQCKRGITQTGHQQ